MEETDKTVTHDDRFVSNNKQDQFNVLQSYNENKNQGPRSRGGKGAIAPPLFFPYLIFCFVKM